MDIASYHILFRISFTVTTILGIIPNVTILLIFTKNAPKELHSYGIFLVNFAVTELICSAAVWLTMNRFYFVSVQDFWFVPIGPCNYISSNVCQWSAATINACLMNIIILIPMSCIYRYFVINHGTPSMRAIISIVIASLVPAVIAVPLQYSSVTLTDLVYLGTTYHHFQFDKSSFKNKIVQWYIQLGGFTFIINFIFAGLIIRKLNKFESILAKKTMSMHRMLTKALVFHTLVHLILVISTVLFYLEAAKIVRFSYCDVLPNLIYSTVPFCNGMVCLLYVPHFRKVLQSWDPRKSTTLRNLMNQNSQESGDR